MLQLFYNVNIFTILVLHSVLFEIKLLPILKVFCFLLLRLVKFSFMASDSQVINT